MSVDYTGLPVIGTVSGLEVRSNLGINEDAILNAVHLIYSGPNALLPNDRTEVIAIWEVTLAGDLAANHGADANLPWGAWTYGGGFAISSSIDLSSLSAAPSGPGGLVATPGNPNASGYYGGGDSAPSASYLDPRNDPYAEDRPGWDGNSSNQSSGGASFGIGISASIGWGVFQARSGYTYIEGAGYTVGTLADMPEGATLIATNTATSVVGLWELPNGGTANQYADGSVVYYNQQSETYVDDGATAISDPITNLQSNGWRFGGGATMDIVHFSDAPENYGGPFDTYGGGIALLGVSVSYTDDAVGWTDISAFNIHIGPQAGVFRERSYYGTTDDVLDSIRGENPIILDLDGNSISVTELSQSTIFVDGGDGLEHRTAWAGAGDGVLFFDADGSGDISERREYVFTDWDPTATSDLEALRSVFDTNGDGKLTSADSTRSDFRVPVLGRTRFFDRIGMEL